MNNYEPNLGVYDMRQDITGLPKALANKINSNVCCGGGGGGGQTQTQGVDPEFRPYIVDMLKNLTTDINTKLSGDEDIVAGFDPAQEESLGYAKQTARDQIKGRGIYDMRRANRDALMDLQKSSELQGAMSGNLGSARMQRATAAGLGDLAMKQQLQRQQDVAQGAERLGSAGTAYQKQAQNILDAKGNLIKGGLQAVTGAGGRTTTTTGGGK